MGVRQVLQSEGRPLGQVQALAEAGRGPRAEAASEAAVTPPPGIIQVLLKIVKI